MLTQENFHYTASTKVCYEVLSIISNRKNDDLRNLKSTQRAPTFVLHGSSIINRTSKNRLCDNFSGNFTEWKRSYTNK
jgi:hypothetical protein